MDQKGDLIGEVVFLREDDRVACLVAVCLADQQENTVPGHLQLFRYILGSCNRPQHGGTLVDPDAVVLHEVVIKRYVLDLVLNGGTVVEYRQATGAQSHGTLVAPMNNTGEPFFLSNPSIP